MSSTNTCLNCQAGNIERDNREATGWALFCLLGDDDGRPPVKVETPRACDCWRDGGPILTG